MKNYISVWLTRLIVMLIGDAFAVIAFNYPLRDALISMGVAIGILLVVDFFLFVYYTYGDRKQ